MGLAPVRNRNDPRQYDDLAGEWWQPDGAFVMLHWLAASRVELIPPAQRDGAVLVDVACGGGLLAPHLAGLGYRHVGVDIGIEATRIARAAGVTVTRGDARTLPLPSACADVVVAGEVLEHVPGTPAVVAEVCRLLRPGGLVVLDTIANTALARFAAVTLAERMPGGPPRRLHDPALFVDRAGLVRAFRTHGVTLTVRGLRLPAVGYLRWLLARRRYGSSPTVRLRPCRLSAVLVQGFGTKEAS